MKKIFIILCIGLIAHSSVDANQVDICETKDGYDLYKCRVEKVCENYQSDNKPVYKNKEYKEASEYMNTTNTEEDSAYIVLDEVKKQYRDNMAKLYSCAMIQTQESSLKMIEEELLKGKNTRLADIMKSRIKPRLTKLKAASDTLKCQSPTHGIIYNKQNINKESTNQACTYIMYLEYLREYYSSIPNILGITKDIEISQNDNEKERKEKEALKKVVKEYSTSQISRLIQSIDNEIEAEISHTYKVFPIAFQAYTEYENNYPLHFLLEIIREDFVLLRRSLHEALMPIAQVGYKIINAMIK